MATSNHALLGEGIKIYIEAMRALLAEELPQCHTGDWWQEGVVLALRDKQRENLLRELERNPGKPRLDLLDTAHFKPVVQYSHNLGLKRSFPDSRQAGAAMDLVNKRRQQWAHPPSGDIPADEAANALYIAWELLRDANRPEAAQVEAVRQRLLGHEPGSGPSTAKGRAADAPAAPTAKGELPWWWEVAAPHDSFKNPRTIDESIFAATLGGVHKGAARADYLDPERFLGATYFTENLKQTIRDTASRLAGGDGPAVTEMQTPFGSGKTHALHSLYHLVRDPGKALAVPGVREALGDVAIPPGVKVAVVDGYEMGVEPELKDNGAAVYTLWGEIAWQLDPARYGKLVASSDSAGTAPGNAVFRQILQAASPCLILIDELVSYLQKLKFANQRKTQNLYRQTIQFVQELLQEAGNVPGVVVMISLPKSRKEFGGLDPTELQGQLGILEELQARADRVVAKRTPVNDSEIYTLMARRLFAPVDRAAATRAVDAYRATYERNRELYDPAVFTADYREQQIAAYPFHPELIDVLYKKWSTETDFPRTRTVLQLLANVVADQWVAQRPAHAIQSAHVNLERDAIKSRIVSAAGSMGGYDGVIAADILGGDAHADMLDEQLGGDYQRFHVARGIATTLLMHSFGGLHRAGALPSDLRLGTVGPGLGPEYVTEILGSLEERLWFVHREGDLLRFQTRPNLYRVIAQSAETQPDHVVSERLRTGLRGVTGSPAGFKVLEWAGADGAIADQAAASIAILPPTFMVGDDGGSQPEAAPRIEALWDRVGGGLRQWRNALLLVAPDRELWRRAEQAMREVLAYEGVREAGHRHGLDVSPAEERELAARAKEKQESLRTAVVTAYRWVYYPTADGLATLSLPVPAVKGDQVANRVVARLSDQDYGTPKILDRVGATYFASKVAPHVWKDPEQPLDLRQLKQRLYEWTYLPLLADRERTVREAVRDGLKPGLWAVAIGDWETSTFTQVVERPEGLDGVVNLFDGTAALVQGELRDLIREQVAPKPRPGPEPDPGPGTIDPPPIVPPPPIIPPPPLRHSRLRLRVNSLEIGKTANLQPYLFKVLAQQDPAAAVDLMITVRSEAGISGETLDSRIVEGLEQLGIAVEWDAGG